MIPNSKKIFLAVFISLSIHAGLFLFIQLFPNFSYAQKEKVVHVLIPGERIATYISLGGAASDSSTASSLPALKQKTQPEIVKPLVPKVAAKQPAEKKNQNSPLKIKSPEAAPKPETPQSSPIATNSTESSSNSAQTQSGGGGQGYGIGSGDGPGTGLSTGNTTQKTQDEMQKYIVKIIRILDAKKYYPRLSKENGEQGTIMVKLILSPRGDLLDYQFVKKSDYERLNSATLETLKTASPFPPLPASYTEARLVVEVPVSFRISSN